MASLVKRTPTIPDVTNNSGDVGETLRDTAGGVEESPHLRPPEKRCPFDQSSYTLRNGVGRLDYQDAIYVLISKEVIQ